MKLSEHNEREVGILQTMQAEGYCRKEDLPLFISKYGVDMRETVEEYENISDPVILAALFSQRVSDRLEAGGWKKI